MKPVVGRKRKPKTTMEVTRKKSILLAEDDADMRDILRFWLEGEGFSVTAVENGWQAIEEARRAAPDVIILDLLMPGVDGYQACRYLRHDAHLFHLPVILFSAVFIDEEEKRFGFEVGADAFVVKTSGFNTLLIEVKRLIASARQCERRPVPENEAALVRTEIEAAAARL